MSDVTRLFGEKAGAYASFRPAYPAQLFDWLAAHSPGRQRALDIGCGNGQASQALLSRFDQVLACDSSLAQLAEARRQPALQLFAADARKLPLQPASLELVIVAQALHWFAGPAFFAEVGRVLKPGGLFCAWCYSLMQINPALDALIEELHGELLKGYWPAGRASVDAGYSDIQSGFAQIPVPPFSIQLDWSFAHMLGYLRTWSAVQLWQREHARDPLALFRTRLSEAWGDTQQRHLVSWPLHFVAGHPGN
ncbi:class I SAM-dependent methyltransferase [Pseudomonas sp. N040]|uniref:class I SAM-dependent methyltransferase n=1 Tax=Pseudomonas sp. N040 TaxID=2785325 RepID=UPI0018A25F8E|nr:class I SAM-dependent methyltransferase [Pseudomonas sp. N040]MBF7730433.1 class I SAM-dependent methyltransferase [Pseudomonas sp. N040]MBW7014076.1 class I SAM-dependent methyltransferase [Pseudomonas sp. N040]